SAEMLEIVDFKVDGQFGEIRRAPVHADIVDIAVVFGDDCRQLGKASGLVDVVDQYPGRKPLRGGIVDVPAHIQPALRLLLEILQCGRLDRVNGDALTWGNDADDPVARHGSPVRGEFDRQIRIDAADGYRRRTTMRRPSPAY